MPSQPAAEIEGRCAPRFEKLRESFAASLAEGELGAAVAMVQNGEPVVDLWGGFADPAHTQPWRSNTRVSVASVTKAMTALYAAL